MNIRPVKYSDYEQLKGWWEFWKFPSPPIDALPKYDEELTTGLMVSINDVNVCAGFLYETNSTICWLEFIVANPNVSKEDRGNCLDRLIEEFTIEAKKYGFNTIFSSIKNESLLNRYIKAGYKIGTKNTNELTKIL
jgi:hypothetical protein